MTSPRRASLRRKILPCISSSRESAAGGMHFATSAACMLRALDVPARYVSGYVCTVEDGAAEVPDYAAHAWVEYYVQGRGWLMLDATPPAGIQAAAQGGRAARRLWCRERRQHTGARCTRTAKRRYAGAPNAKQRGTGALSSGRGGLPGAPEAPGGPGAHAAGLPPPVRRALAGAACSLALVLAICLSATVRRALCLRRRRALFAQNTCRAALGLYRYALRLNGGAPLPEHIVLLAEKAKFSRSGLSAQELEALRGFAAARARRRRRKQIALPRRLWDMWALCLLLKPGGFCAFAARRKIQTAFAEGKMNKMEKLKRGMAAHGCAGRFLPCCCPRWRC